MVLAGAIALVLFHILLKEKNGLIISFLVTLFAVDCSSGVFAARNQIFSFLIFELEVYCLIGLLEVGKKRYFWILLGLAFALINFHDTMYPLFFVMMMPYLAEIFFSKIWKLESSNKLEYSHLKNGKYLIILLVLSILIGFCTPLFGTAYTNLVLCMEGVSTNFITELQPVNLVTNYTLSLITVLVIAILCFTKTKVKIKDLLFTLGFIVFSLIAMRNLYFMYLIGIIFFTNIFTSFVNTYIKEKNRMNTFQKLEKSRLFMIVCASFIVGISIYRFSHQLAKEYVNELDYPKEATSWILENVDYENARIWTHFNWGSYLELNGIKVFLDSRSGMYTVESNENCTVLSDWIDVTQGNINYQIIFDKYDITHVLVENYELIDNYICDDENYHLIYKDSQFSLYEKN